VQVIHVGAEMSVKATLHFSTKVFYNVVVMTDGTGVGVRVFSYVIRHLSDWSVSIKMPPNS